jgi:hypothetical protein
MYIVWAEYVDGRKASHFQTRDADLATIRFGELAGAAGVEYVLLTLNGNAIDSWGT